jgi:hypothetical protein
VSPTNRSSNPSSKGFFVTSMLPLIEAAPELAQISPMPDARAVNNSFVNNKGFLLFQVTGNRRSIHTRQNFACGLFRLGMLGQGKVRTVVLFRSVCPTYATVCRGPGLRTRLRLILVLESSLGVPRDCWTHTRVRNWGKPMSLATGTSRFVRLRKSFCGFAVRSSNRALPEPG